MFSVYFSLCSCVHGFINLYLLQGRLHQVTFIPRRNLGSQFHIAFIFLYCGGKTGVPRGKPWAYKIQGANSTPDPLDVNTLSMVSMQPVCMVVIQNNTKITSLNCFHVKQVFGRTICFCKSTFKTTSLNSMIISYTVVEFEFICNVMTIMSWNSLCDVLFLWKSQKITLLTSAHVPAFFLWDESTSVNSVGNTGI